MGMEKGDLNLDITNFFFWGMSGMSENWAYSQVAILIRKMKMNHEILGTYFQTKPCKQQTSRNKHFGFCSFFGGPNLWDKGNPYRHNCFFFLKSLGGISGYRLLLDHGLAS